MASPALYGGQRYARYPSTPYIVVLTGNASANTKGSYVEVASSTAFPAAGIRVILTGVVGVDNLVDIAIGAAASEQIIISNIPVTNGNGSRTISYDFPIFIPAGTRLSARVQGTTGGQDCYISIEICAVGALGASALQECTTYGAATADSGGTNVDPGGTINTKGAYSQLTAATTAPIKQLIVCIGNQVNTARTTAFWAADIAIGAGGSEQIIIPDIPFRADSFQDNLDPAIFRYQVDIPSGLRLAMRAQCQTNDATDRLFDAVLIGVG